MYCISACGHNFKSINWCNLGYKLYCPDYCLDKNSGCSFHQFQDKRLFSGMNQEINSSPHNEWTRSRKNWISVFIRGGSLAHKSCGIWNLSEHMCDRSVRQTKPFVDPRAPKFQFPIAHISITWDDFRKNRLYVLFYHEIYKHKKLHVHKMYTFWIFIQVMI